MVEPIILFDDSDAIDWWQCGVDADATDRALLQSCRPSLYTNVHCNALVAAVVSRQISVVRLLLQVSTDPPLGILCILFTMKQTVRWSRGCLCIYI